MLTQTCSRCGGTGSYSYCQQYGTTCFKCGGRKVTLTKRGAEAQRYLTALRSKRLADVVVGDKWWHQAPDCLPGARSEWVTVEEVGTEIVRTRTGADEYNPWREIEQIAISGHGVKSKTATRFIGGPDTIVRIAQDAAAKAATFAQALAYQATLTKAGTVRKTRKGAQ